jgi:hypothetical protein
MQKQLWRGAFSLAGLLMLAGCATSGGVGGMFSAATTSQTSAQSYSPTDPASVHLHYSTMPSCKYTELGSVNVDIYNIVGISLPSSEIDGDFQSAAAKIGGTDVIHITQNLDSQTGAVVRCLN